MLSKSALYIVTGSSKGIGEALVKKLLEEPNNRVIGMARSQMELFHPNFKFIQIDLSNFQEILEHIDDIFPEESFAKVVLVNNAGWIGEIVHLGNMTPVGIYKTFVLNTIAPTVLMNAFIKKYGNQMEVERLIVNISSGAAKKAIDGWACYSASKAAINMLSEAVAIEASLDNTGIRVFSVAPGVVDTDMQSEIRKAEVESFSSLSKFVGLKENQLLSTPDHAAKKLLELIQNPGHFEEVLQDVREF